jgi:hypothetical protein
MPSCGRSIDRTKPAIPNTMMNSSHDAGEVALAPAPVETPDARAVPLPETSATNGARTRLRP